MENNPTPKSEATNATQNQNAKDANLLRDVANIVQTGTFSLMTDEEVNEVASLMSELLRSSGCSVFITTPQDVINHVEMDQEGKENPIVFTSEEAREVCRDIFEDKYVNEVEAMTFGDILRRAIKAKKGGAK